MLHPLYKTLAAEPQLVLEHASAYLELAGVETREALQHWRLRALIGTGVVASCWLALALAGAALLLLAAKPWATLDQPWLLVFTPLLPLLAAGVGVLWLRSGQPPKPFVLLREQWEQDLHLLDRAEEQRP